MKVLVVEPGFLPYEKEISGLPDMQATVGGYIQAIYPFRDNAAVVCNEDGMGLHLPFNRSIPERSYGGVFGTFFVCGLGEEDFISLTPEQLNAYKARFQKAEILVMMLGDKPVVMEVEAKRRQPSGKAKHPQKPPMR